MSKVKIEIPDDRWFRGERQIRPQDKQLCVVINKTTGIPSIGLYLEHVLLSEYFCQEIHDCFFVDVFKYNSEKQTFCPMDNVDRWKPLELPVDVNERVLAEIEKWFEEDE